MDLGVCEKEKSWWKGAYHHTPCYHSSKRNYSGCVQPKPATVDLCLQGASGYP
jgi:hypothetical protein